MILPGEHPPDLACCRGHALHLAAACDLPVSARPYFVSFFSSEKDSMPWFDPSGKPEPLFALYGKRCLEPMKRLLNDRNYRIHDFTLQVRPVMSHRRNSLPSANPAGLS
jgi:molybdopterin-guanine dinucleotide biosynthesis protein A